MVKLFLTFLGINLLFPQEIVYAKNKNITKTAIVTSGGVSLGSYKAGFLLRLTQFIIQSNSVNSIDILSGASAGSLNSLLTVDALCNSQNSHFDESLYYKMWVPIGINELFSPAEVKSTSIFHRKGSNDILNALKERFRKGYAHHCQKTLIIPITRTEIFNTIKDKRAYTPGLRNFVIVRITGNGENKPVSFENEILKTNSNDQITLPFTENFDENFETVRSVIFASTAFPIAFSPVKLKICETPELPCTQNTTTEYEFIDGGVFDNTPLGLSNELLKQKNTSIKNRTFYLIDSSNNSFKNVLTNNKTKTDNLSSMFFNYLNNLIQVARNSEEKRLLTDNLEVINQVKNIGTTLPPVSGPLNAFMGFYDIDFRKFDFYMAYFDADYLIKHLYPNSPKPIDLNSDYDNLSSCLSFIRTSSPASDFDKSSSEKEALCKNSFLNLPPNLKTLLQLSLVRAYYFCQSKEGTSIFNQGHCKFHYQLNAPLDLIGLDPNYDLSSFKDNIDDINIILDFLDHYQYQYHDLDLIFSNQKTGKAKVYESSRIIFEEMRKHQPIQDSAMVGLAQTLALNNLEYNPPKKAININFGTAVEIGVNYGLTFISPYLSSTASMYYHDFESVLGNQNVNVAVIPNIGLLYSPSFLRVPTYNLGFAFGTGYGYQFANINSGLKTTKNCNLDKYNESATNCSVATTIIYSTINFFDRITLKLGFNIYEKKNNNKHPRKGFFMLGYQFF